MTVMLVVIVMMILVPVKITLVTLFIFVDDADYYCQMSDSLINFLLVPQILTFALTGELCC